MKVLLVSMDEVAATAEHHSLHNFTHACNALIVAPIGVQQIQSKLVINLGPYTAIQVVGAQLNGAKICGERLEQLF